MKNIAIITFSDFNTNYGSMLQALSLKIYLEGFGHRVVFIKYREFNEPVKEKKIKKELHQVITYLSSTVYFYRYSSMFQRISLGDEMLRRVIYSTTTLVFKTFPAFSAFTI